MPCPKLGGNEHRIKAVQERLGVEQVHLAGTARHEQENTSLGLGRKVSGPGGERSTPCPAGPALSTKKVSKPEQPEPTAGSSQEFATAPRQERLRAGTAVREGLGHPWYP